MDDFRFVNHGFRHVLLFILRRSACFVTLQNHFFLIMSYGFAVNTLYVSFEGQEREKRYICINIR